MSLPPDRIDALKARIARDYRHKQRERLEAMQAEVRDITVGVKRLGLRLSLIAGQVNVMLIETRSDETTVRLPALPPPGSPAQ